METVENMPVYDENGDTINIFNLLSLDLSPCLQKKIIQEKIVKKKIKENLL